MGVSLPVSLRNKQASLLTIKKKCLDSFFQELANMSNYLSRMSKALMVGRNMRWTILTRGLDISHKKIFCYHVRALYKNQIESRHTWLTIWITLKSCSVADMLEEIFGLALAFMAFNLIEQITDSRGWILVTCSNFSENHQKEAVEEIICTSERIHSLEPTRDVHKPRLYGPLITVNQSLFK